MNLLSVSKTRKDKSIELNINDNLIMHLINGGESSADG